MRGQSLLAGLGLVTLLGACGGGADSTTGPMDAQGNSVTVGNNFFSPADLSVATGTTVTWTWAAGAVEHNVTFDDGQHSATQSSGSFPRTFSAAGTYPYHCTIHGAAVDARDRDRHCGVDWWHAVDRRWRQAAEGGWRPASDHRAVVTPRRGGAAGPPPARRR